MGCGWSETVNSQFLAIIPINTVYLLNQSKNLKTWAEGGKDKW